MVDFRHADLKISKTLTKSYGLFVDQPAFLYFDIKGSSLKARKIIFP